MQPYFFPYLGYWQLLNAVDKFVIYDDVNYIPRGYINKNSILLNGTAYRFSIPIEKASQNKLIKETKLKFDIKGKENFLKTIALAYKKAPFYKDAVTILENIIYNNESDLTKYLKYHFEKIFEYLDINTEILLSSEIEKNNECRAKEKIIEICHKLGANQYINAIGGQELYKTEDFLKNGIILNFINMNEIQYKQFYDNFVPNLSIIDIMMFNSPKTIKAMLNEYKLL